MEFKSQVCTTVEQSKRLFALGLKKETADMWYLKMIKDYKGNEVPEIRKKWWLTFDSVIPGAGFEQYVRLPAWSLHRLMKIIQNDEKQVSYILDKEDLTIEWFDNGGWRVELFRHIENNIYDSTTSCIEYMFKKGLIDPEYLEKQK